MFDIVRKDGMSLLTTGLVIFNSVLVATTMLFLSLYGVARADDDFSLTSSSSLDPPSSFSPSLLLRPLLNFGKLRETAGSFDWNDFTSAGRSDSKATSDVSNSNESYLDPNGPNVQFILFTRNRQPHNLKLENSEDFKRSGFNVNRPTKIIIHGFLSSIKEDIFILNRDAYMATGDYNVIGMDWSVLCEFEYFTAMRGAQIAGATLGSFINWIIKEGVPYANIHIVGHSLGAHVSAMGADKVKGGKVGRITGLDPAGPGYNDVPVMYRLDPTDATLVDVIHTNVRVLSLSQPQGHLDFYPNGGRFQPGCPNMYDIWTLGESVECNHGRAYRYFAESVRNKRSFKSYRCPSVETANAEHCIIETNVYMGQEETYELLDCVETRYKVDFALKPFDWQIAVRRCNEQNVSWYGLYYLKTNSKPPYSLS